MAVRVAVQSFMVDDGEMDGVWAESEMGSTTEEHGNNDAMRDYRLLLLLLTLPTTMIDTSIPIDGGYAVESNEDK